MKEVIERPGGMPIEVETLDNGKYVVLHCKNNVWKLYNLEINGYAIKGTLDTLIGFHLKYKNHSKKLNRYRERNKKVLNDVHIYTNLTDLQPGLTEIPINSIYKIETHKKAKGVSTAATIGIIMIAI